MNIGQTIFKAKRTQRQILELHNDHDRHSDLYAAKSLGDDTYGWFERYFGCSRVSSQTLTYQAREEMKSAALISFVPWLRSRRQNATRRSEELEVAP